jgi:DNA-binding MltR family transcriptional regulator
MKKEFLEFKAELDLFSEVFYPESDRSAIIVGSSQIDIELTKLLSKVLKPKKEKKDELLESDNPLSTLSSKVNMSYRLGLIDDELKSMLNIFKKIRNDMSHQVLNCSLEEAPHSDRIINLHNSCSQDPLYLALLETFPKKWEHSRHSAKIKTFIVFMLGRISSSTYRVKPLYEINKEYLVYGAQKKC